MYCMAFSRGTGAIYGYYTDKEAMFDALVSEPGQELVERSLFYLLPSGLSRPKIKITPVRYEPA